MSTPSAKFSAQRRAQKTPVGEGLAPALFAYFACLGAMLVLVGVAQSDDFNIEWLRTFDYVLIGFGVVSLFAFPQSSRELLSLPSAWLTPVLRAAGILVLVIVVVTGLLHLFPVLAEDTLLQYRAADKSFGYVFVDFCVLPPIGEELVFRGVVLTGLIRAFGERPGVIVSSLLFATLHISPLAFVHLSIVGYVLAKVRLETKSLYPCIFLHSFYNAIVILLDW